MLSPSTYFSFAWVSMLRVHDGDRISLKDTIPPWATCKGLPLLKWSKSWTSDEIFILSHIYSGDDCGASTCIFEGYNAQMCPFNSICPFSHGKFDQRETEKNLYHPLAPHILFLSCKWSMWCLLRILMICSQHWSCWSLRRDSLHPPPFLFQKQTEQKTASLPNGLCKTTTESLPLSLQLVFNINLSMSTFSCL